MIGNDILYKKSYLQQNVDQDCDEGEGQVEDQPDCYRLDVRGEGQTGGHARVFQYHSSVEERAETCSSSVSSIVAVRELITDCL